MSFILFNQERGLFMQKRKLRILISAVVLTTLLLGSAMYLHAGAGSGTAKAQSVYSSLSKIQKRILSGFLSSELDPQSTTNAKFSAKLGNYFPTNDDGCPQNRGSNIKVNQNCLNITDADLQGRAQANNETSIAQDPLHPNHVIASYNDYRRGDGNCYGAYSLDQGQNWTDTTIPMGYTRGTAFGGVTRQYWQAGGDTSVAWDTKGNAYFSCQVFMRGAGGLTNNPDTSSAFYVFRSTANGGASWNFPGRPAAEQLNTGSTILLDKQLLTVDNHVGSPFQDRVYVTYTLFAADGTAYIYEVNSNNYGESFSAPVLVSANSGLCSFTFGLPTPHGNCNENQFSQPFTGSDGALYVTWANFNNTVTGNDNRNQMLLAKSIDGGLTFSAPVKVSDYYDLPDCATYQGGQDFGRACVPEKGASMNSVFRATNYPSGAVDPTNPSKVVVTFGSYINKNSNETNGCVPAGFAPSGNNAYTGVKTAGACNNKILVSASKDGGATFTGTTTDPRKLPVVNQSNSQKTTDQWWQWAAMTSSGRLAVSYYDRQYDQDEFNGNMDFSLSGSNPSFMNFKTERVTSSSMPVPTQFPDKQGNSVFFGDYTGLTVVGNSAHPLWMDTRSPDLFLCPGTGVPGVPPVLCTLTVPSGIVANDQDIFTRGLSVP
jgi:hypothetical protein